VDINNVSTTENDRSMNFDFDEWVALAKCDPQAFEQRRLEWCQRFIAGAPHDYQRRLSGILFQINMEKRRSANAVDSCIRLSQLMWDKFEELRQELQALMAGNAMRAGFNGDTACDFSHQARHGQGFVQGARIIPLRSAQVTALAGNS